MSSASRQPGIDEVRAEIAATRQDLARTADQLTGKARSQARALGRPVALALAAAVVAAVLVRRRRRHSS
ncbi:MAG TPA: DUF3618 domain-containing protein [Jatrophihabitans sp.]|nr:DUF3618 domain-containing protein [Jatrophihabitans sp.]